MLYALYGSTSGEVALASTDGAINQAVLCIRPNFSNEYLYQYLSYKKKSILSAFLQGGQGNLSGAIIKNLKVLIPKDYKEQQKIADFLTTIDDKIHQLKKKKHLLEQYKKGMMQLLFTRQVSFKDENENSYPDWEVIEFGEAFVFINTNSLSRSQLNYQNGNVKNIHYGDIHMKYHSNFDIVKENVPFVNSDIDISKIKPEQYCRKGDLIIADASEDYNDIGKAIEIVNIDNQKLIAGLHTYLARSKEKCFAKGFLGYLMNTYEVRSQIMKIATGISVLGISKTNFSKILIRIPSFDEQQKIASFLTNLDNKVALVQTQIQQTQTFKKGLLQKMFV